jgi:hypothetical protein
MQEFCRLSPWMLEIDGLEALSVGQPKPVLSHVGRRFDRGLRHADQAPGLPTSRLVLPISRSRALGWFERLVWTVARQRSWWAHQRSVMSSGMVFIRRSGIGNWSSVANRRAVLVRHTLAKYEKLSGAV